MKGSRSKDLNQIKQQAYAHFENERLDQARKLFQSLCKSNRSDAESWFMLGVVYGKLGRHGDSIGCFDNSIKLNPSHAATHYARGTALGTMQQLDAALGSLQKAHKLQSNLPGLQAALGQIQASLGNEDAAINHYSSAVAQNPEVNQCITLGRLLQKRYQIDQAAEYFSMAVKIQPQSPIANYYQAGVLHEQGMTREAIELYATSLSLAPDFVEARWKKCRLLPILYETEESIHEAREYYSQGLCEIIEVTDLSSPKGRQAALRGVMSCSNFYLAYQGEDDITLQKMFGGHVSRIVAANFPQWSEQVAMPALTPGEKIRVGYASACFGKHNGTTWMLGWLRNHDKSRFEVYTYHTGHLSDSYTDDFKAYSDHWYHRPGDLQGVCERIKSDQLHILMYPEIGMNAITIMMAALRLAPIQCTGVGHPVTSGIPTVDYWLSSELMEPDNAQEHYSETLVRLPNIAISYARNQRDSIHVNPPVATREEYGLSGDDVVYLCGQSLFKYLPQHDYLYAEIAQRVPEARFVFISLWSEHLSELLSRRMRRAFSDKALDFGKHVLFLPRMPHEKFVDLNRVSDVFLDNPSWSGYNTTLSAIDCDLPIVTLPSAHMRGRHTYAMLKMIGVEETIADNSDEFVELAVRLGLDKTYRQEISDRIKENSPRLYDDKECIRGVEMFYTDAVSAYRE